MTTTNVLFWYMDYHEACLMCQPAICEINTHHPQNCPPRGESANRAIRNNILLDMNGICVDTASHVMYISYCWKIQFGGGGWACGLQMSELKYPGVSSLSGCNTYCGYRKPRRIMWFRWEYASVEVNLFEPWMSSGLKWKAFLVEDL